MVANKAIRVTELNNFFSFGESVAYSAVYLTTPETIAPFDNDETTFIKLLNAPTIATPAGPINTAANLPEIKVVSTLITVLTPEKIVLL